MLRKITIFAFALAAFAASAQTSPTLAKALSHPKGVADLFLSCPFLGINVDGATDDNPQGMKGYFDFSEDPKYGTEEQFEVKSDLLKGNYLDLDDKNPVTKLVVDEKDGYLRIVMGEDMQNIVIVYYKHPDGSLIPAVRFEDAEGEFSSVAWGFYDITDSHWSRINNADILPPDYVNAFIRSPTAKDQDCLAVTGWDISLPQVGTTARLIPQSYESDLDDARKKISIPGSSMSSLRASTTIGSRIRCTSATA